MGKETGIIYCCTNKINGKMYIGQTIATFIYRRKQHISAMNRGSSCNIHRAIRKYGEANFSWKILEENVLQEELNDLEMIYIDLFHTFTDGYNMNHGGGTSWGYVCTDETKRKISVANSGENNHWFGVKQSKEWCEEMSRLHKGKTVSAETRKKLSDVNKGENSPWWGKQHTDETKEKMRQSSLGRKASDETKRRIGLASKGRRHTEEAKRKMSETRSGEKNAFYGKHHTEEFLVTKRVAVNQLDLDGNFIKRWDSARRVLNELGICANSICAICKGKRNRVTAGGFKWEYADKERKKK